MATGAATTAHTSPYSQGAPCTDAHCLQMVGVLYHWTVVESGCPKVARNATFYTFCESQRSCIERKSVAVEG